MRVLLNVTTRAGELVYEDLSPSGSVAVPRRGDLFEVGGVRHEVLGVAWKPEASAGLMRCSVVVAPLSMYLDGTPARDTRKPPAPAAGKGGR